MNINLGRLQETAEDEAKGWTDIIHGEVKLLHALQVIFDVF